MSNLPSLGPRGEGWVILQLIVLGLIGLAGLTLSTPEPDSWSSVGTVAGTILLLAGAALGLAGISGLQGGDALQSRGRAPRRAWSRPERSDWSAIRSTGR